MKETEELTALWKQALESGDPDRVLALYRKDAVLWGTLSSTRRDNPGRIREYFVDFASRENISVIFTNENIREYGDFAVNSGYYTFYWIEEGKKLTVPARYSFAYLKEGGQWFILDHHSSLVPETPLDISKYIG